MFIPTIVPAPQPLLDDSTRPTVGTLTKSSHLPLGQFVYRVAHDRSGSMKSFQDRFLGRLVYFFAKRHKSSRDIRRVLDPEDGLDVVSKGTLESSLDSNIV